MSRELRVESWDTDQAVAQGRWDEDLDGRPADARYGVTGDQELAGEPLAVALAQEEPDAAAPDGDDRWALVVEDDDFVHASHGDRCAEESAMHVVTP